MMMKPELAAALESLGEEHSDKLLSTGYHYIS